MLAMAELWHIPLPELGDVLTEQQYELFSLMLILKSKLTELATRKSDKKTDNKVPVQKSKYIGDKPNPKKMTSTEYFEWLDNQLMSKNISGII